MPVQFRKVLKMSKNGVEVTFDPFKNINEVVIKYPDKTYTLELYTDYDHVETVYRALGGGKDVNQFCRDISQIRILDRTCLN